MKKLTKTPPWPDRIRKLIGSNQHSELYHLTKTCDVTVEVVLDLLMGKKKPSRRLARKLLQLERAPMGSGAGVTAFVQAMPEGPKRDRVPALPAKGPLGYERYLELHSRCARAFISQYSREDDAEERWNRPRPPWLSPPATHMQDRQRSAFRLAMARLEEAKRRFPDEIRGFPLTVVATREGLDDGELRILSHLIKEDVGVFEGRGGVPGHLLVQIACGRDGDRLATRAVLAPEGRLRRAGLIERESREGIIFSGGRPEGPSVLDGIFQLTKRGRQEHLGTLLSKSVSEAPASKMWRMIQPRFGLDAVVLSSNHREQVDSFRGELRHRRLIYETWGLSEIVHYGRGLILLLEGPPGTGKTMLSEALAHEEGLPFMSANLAHKSMWVGESEKNAQRIFREARECGALLFLDEADGLFGSREFAQRSWEVRDVNVLLKEVEEFEGICVLATNHPVVLDRALESRLSLRLEFGMPDPEMRIAIWKKHLPSQLPLSPDVSLLTLAQRYDLSGRDIKQAVLMAVRAAANRGGAGGVVMMVDLERAAAERMKETCSIGFTRPHGSA